MSEGVPLARLRLLQLSSPAFPIGAFAYSQGLEHAVEAGWVSDVTSLRSWLHGLLTRPLTHTDLPLLAKAARAWNESNCSAVAGELAEKVYALRETRELQAEERHLGSSLARVLNRLGLQEAGPFVGHERASYVVMYGLAIARWELPIDEALCAYAFSWLENQVSAASRVMALGQLDAQSVLSDLLTLLPELAQQAIALSDRDIGLTVPAFAMASSWHEEQYSRLFRS